MRYDYLLLPGFLIAFYACGGFGERAGDTPVADTDRTEQASTSAAAGDWTPLLNGTDLTGWHVYGKGAPGKSWVVGPDSVLTLEKTGDGGDLVTDASYGNYELSLDWKIADCGNSGVIYNVTEDAAYQHPWLTGPEMQVLDDKCHPDAKIYTHKAGDLYDMVAGDSTVVHPAGEWNTARLVVTPGHVEHWLNGQKLVEYDNTGDAWEKMIADSKFKDFDAFGSATEGRIALQDHGDVVSFRRIRIREL